MAGLRFEPTVNLGHILTLLGCIVAALASYGVMDKRVAVLEERAISQSALDRRQDDDRAEMKRSNREDFKEINGKLDKILLGLSERTQFTTGRR